MILPGAFPKERGKNPCGVPVAGIFFSPLRSHVFRVPAVLFAL